MMSLRDSVHVNKCNAGYDSILLIVVGFMHILEDTHRGQNLRWENSRQNRTRACYEDLCVH